ncbi:hypothetical protein L207DRAFT_528610 [Hyaloscypha variabilis F]|uniref:Uncharacterized protein n=1 Tax=Hyaloscypha variabilis (strain UAMH 11265 / GT02V1 / F) TaxID=1149755 RepID=A0A2J6RNZ2_HYAVF|nr:hypothetical protein L207DRAFT_528610 [Hyaloscypha variabilis F]
MDAYSRHPVLHMTVTELLVVEPVRLDVGHPIWLKRKQLQKRGVAEDPQFQTGKLHCFTSSFLPVENLREFHLSIDGRYGASDGDILHFITQFPFWIEGCKALSKLTVELHIPAQYIDVRRCDTIVRTTMKRLVKKVGVRGHYVCTRPLPCDGNQIEVWE